MALSYRVRSFGELLLLARTMDDAFPVPFSMHQRIDLNVLGVASIASARGLERLVRFRVRDYGWRASNLAGLRSLAHLAELLAYADQHLGDTIDDIIEGELLGLAESEDQFEHMELMAFALHGAGEGCAWTVRVAVTTLARRLVIIARDPKRPDILTRLTAARDDIASLMQRAAPMA